MKIPLSVCIITFNEEDNIARCLKSLSFADEIIVIDSGSTDKTEKIIHKFKNIRLLKRKFDNYVNQKNFGIKKASHDWVLALDADETVPPELASELVSVLSTPIFDAYEIPRITRYMNKWIRHGGWYPDFQTRLFKKKEGLFTGILVHEKVKTNGTLGKLRNPLRHYSYKNIADHINFINKYSDLTAKEKQLQGKSSGVLLAFFEGVWKFFSMYILKRGFLDGKEGFILAVFGFFYNFLKYIKLFEKKEN